MSANPAMTEFVVGDLTAKATEINNLVEKVAAATTDMGKLVHDFREDENSPHEMIQKYLAFRAELDEKREAATKRADDWIRANLLPKATEDIDVDALKAQIKDLRAGYKTARDYFVMTVGSDEEAAKILEEHKVPEPRNLRGSSGGGSGTGSRRPRIANLWINGDRVFKTTEKDGEKIEVSNFTLAAQKLSTLVKGASVKPADLHAAAFEAAKTDDLNTLNGVPFEFEYVVNGADNATVTATVKVQPRDPNATEDPSDK